MGVERQPDQEKSDRHREEQIQQQSLQKIQVSYDRLQKKYEQLKVLELNLRHEIYDLKKQLLAIRRDENINDEQDHFLILVELKERMNREIDDLLREKHIRTNSLHRPVKNTRHLIGLGKEYMKSMSEQNEYNENQQQDKNTGKQLNEGIVNDSSNEIQKTPQQLVENKTQLPKEGITDFRQLQSFVTDLNKQIADEGTVNLTNTSGETNNQVSNQDNEHSANFSYKDLIHAENIYVKPFQGYRSRTTTTMNIMDEHEGSTESAVENETGELTNGAGEPNQLHENNDFAIELSEDIQTDDLNEKVESDSQGIAVEADSLDDQGAQEELLETSINSQVIPPASEYEQLTTMDVRDEINETVLNQASEDEDDIQSANDLEGTVNDSINDTNTIPDVDIPTDDETESDVTNVDQEIQSLSSAETNESGPIESKQVKNQSFLKKLWEKIK